MLKSNRRWSDDITYSSRLTPAVGGAWIDGEMSPCRPCYLNAWPFIIFNIYIVRCLSNFFRVIRVEFEAMSRIYISGSLIHHFGHSVTYKFLCKIPQIKLQCMQEYHTIKFREILERLGKGEKNQKIKIQLLCENPDPLGSIVWGLVPCRLAIIDRQRWFRHLTALSIILWSAVFSYCSITSLISHNDCTFNLGLYIYQAWCDTTSKCIFPGATSKGLLAKFSPRIVGLNLPQLAIHDHR